MRVVSGPGRSRQSTVACATSPASAAASTASSSETWCRWSSATTSGRRSKPVAPTQLMAATILSPVMSSDPERTRWGSRLLFLGVFLFAVLVALAAMSIRQEWQQRIGQSRSDVIFQLVQGKTPSRPTETPGASAWLNLELRRYRERIADPVKARLYGEVAEWQDTRSVPPFFALLRQLLASPARPPDTVVRPRLVSPDPMGDPPGPFSLRTQSFLELDRHWFAMTRRTALDSTGLPALPNPSTRLLA